MTDGATLQERLGEIEPDVKKRIDKATEQALFLMIDGWGAFIWRMDHDVAHGRISEKDWSPIDKDREKLVRYQAYALSRLPNVVEGLGPFTYTGELSPKYWVWYKWWKSYIKSLSDEEWQELDRVNHEKGDAPKFYPSGSWKV